MTLSKVSALPPASRSITQAGAVGTPTVNPANAAQLRNGVDGLDAAPATLKLSSQKALSAIGAAQSYLGGAAALALLPSVGANNTFTPNQVYLDNLGKTHVRMDRSFNGVPVFGQQIIVHLASSGTVEDTTDTNAAIPTSLSTTPALDADSALRVALKAFGVSPENTPSARLVVFPQTNGQYRLAYQVDLKKIANGKSPLNMTYLVDANSGQVLLSFNKLDIIQRRGVATPRAALRTAAGAAAAGNATSLYYGNVQVGTTKDSSGQWHLTDATRGLGIQSRDAHNGGDNTAATDFVDANNVWGEAGDDARLRNGGIDAQYSAQSTYDMYKAEFGRNSIDDQGEKLVNNVHISEDYVNAFWDGSQMYYGDGNGTDSTVLTSLDVGGHEISHGLTERTAGLIYSGESGGLNEAMSDIYGKGVEWFAAKTNPAVHFSWTVGKVIWTPAVPDDGLRYMDDPTKDDYSVDNYKNYPQQTEVHGSSGIANNAFFLMAAGGKNRTSGKGVDASKAMGIENALKVMYRAETVYFTPSTTFKQAGAAVVKAATDLFGAGSQEVQTATAAWTAVGAL